MNKWIGRTEGDHRVVCFDTKKVYSCPGSAALDTDLRENEVEAVCNRIVKYSVNNMSYDWYAQYLIENRGEEYIRPHPPKPTVVINTITSHRQRLRKNGTTLSKYRGLIPPIHRLLTEIFTELGTNTLEMFVGDLHKLLIAKGKAPTDSRNKFETTITPWGLVRHLKTHEKVYKNILSMELSERYKRSCGRQTTWVKMTYKEGITKEKDIYVYDDDESYLRKYNGNNTQPVVNLDTYRVYSSLRNAGKITRMDPKRILWCCLDDIDSLPYNGRMVKFAYGRIVNEE